MKVLYCVTADRITKYMRGYDYAENYNKISFFEGVVYKSNLDKISYFNGKKAIFTYDAEKRFNYQERLRAQREV